MPKYVFKCSTCGKSVQKYTTSTTTEYKCECGEMAKRQMPNLRGLKNTETIDKFTNKKHMDGQQEILKERKADYYWEVEVPKMVNSGTYSVETMLEQGWVTFNEKGEMIINTKPPGKR